MNAVAFQPQWYSMLSTLALQTDIAAAANVLHITLRCNCEQIRMVDISARLTAPLPLQIASCRLSSLVKINNYQLEMFLFVL